MCNDVVHQMIGNGLGLQVYCDNYLDGGYHVPHAHSSLAACLDLPSYSTSVSIALLRFVFLFKTKVSFPRLSFAW